MTSLPAQTQDKRGRDGTAAGSRPPGGFEQPHRGSVQQPASGCIFEAFIAGEIEFNEIMPKIQALHQRG